MLKIPLSGCFFTVLVFSSFLQVCVSECVPTVFAKRRILYEPEGGSVSLWCDVWHCKQNWTGGWGIRQELFTFLTPSQRVQLSSDAITDSTTRLFLTIHNLNQSDSGAYQCNIKWEEINSQGHVIRVNVTAAEPTGRKLSYRLLVCAAASLCFPLVLVLVCCVSLDHQPPPPVPPPRSRNSRKISHSILHYVVYAALTISRPRQQSSAEETKATTAVVYSTMTFSTA
ncbi:hypothetical protein Baya_4859 [Bagarius yarrelli]|uniref:Ig-like domain-containing protein n=1 Tax=Bagarius yarrelli TaxID=175774 RepID=A0A556TRS1_BAGYA|nr:hypothetical protein Baya_4859 [Bagarius yarrelli]